MSDFALLNPAEFEDNGAETKKKLEQLYYQCFVLLGGGGVKVELEDCDYDTAWARAVSVYRSHSSNSFYKTWGTMTLETGRVIYVLNERIDNVLRIFRTRGFFGGLGSGLGSFESFGAATANILLRGGNNPHAATIDLASWDFLLQYQETLDRVFAREIVFTYRPENHTLTLTQVPRFDECVAIEVSVLRSYNELLDNHFCRDWLQKYTLAELRVMLGEKYSKFATTPGAQGGTVLKGNELKQQGEQDKVLLVDDLHLYADNGIIPLVCRG